MKSQAFGLLDLTQMQLNVLQIILENHRNSVIVQEFIVTTRKEIAAAINSEKNRMRDIKRGLDIYGISATTTSISGIVMAITMKTFGIGSEDPILVGFGGLDAIKRVYQ